jgi:hypothetical protein
MKTHIPPPARVKVDSSYRLQVGNHYVTAWDIVRTVASDYRYKYAVAGEVKRDLLLFASLKEMPVFIGVKERRTPFFYFDREMANAWLDAGGRAWIIAELEARSTRRVVVAFPGRRS